MYKKNIKMANFVLKDVKENPGEGYEKFLERHPSSKVTSSQFYRWKRERESDEKVTNVELRTSRPYSFKINLKNSLSSEELKLLEKIRTLPEPEQKSCIESIAKIFFLRNAIEGTVTSYKIVQQLTK
jgi:hypothetical protein